MVLHYKEYGNKQAPLIVFLHGGGVSGWMWDNQVKYFSNYHCLVPDLPEHGANNEAMKFSIKTSAEELIKLINEKKGKRKVTVIGFSLGAQVTVQMISMRPDLVDFIMINSALVRPFTSIKKWIRPSIKLVFPLIKQRWFAKLQAKSIYIEKENFEKYYEDTCQIKRESLIRILEENMSFTLPDEFSHVKGKILVTVGEKEKAVMGKSARDLAQANLNCQSIIIPNIGHGVSLANPDLFNNLVETWIQGGNITTKCKVIN